MIGSWSNRIMKESRCHIRDRHALDTTNQDANYVALPLALTLYVLLRDIRNTRRHRGGTTGAETCAVPKNSLITPDCAVSAPILTYGISGRNTLLRASRTTGLSG